MIPNQRLAKRHVAPWALIWSACVMIGGWPAAASAADGVPRYACVPATASLVTAYFDLPQPDASSLFRELEVTEDGSGSVGRLTDYFERIGLHWRAFNGLSSRSVKEYLAAGDRCVVVVTGGSAGHSYVLFHGPDDQPIMSDMLGSPKQADREIAKACARSGTVFIVVGRKTPPNPAVLYARRHVAIIAPAAGIAVLLGVVSILRKRTLASRRAET